MFELSIFGLLVLLSQIIHREHSVPKGQELGWAGYPLDKRYNKLDDGNRQASEQNQSSVYSVGRCCQDTKR